MTWKRREGNGAEAPKIEKEEPRETSTERADRKREELKRALEEKAKVLVRKKRKFLAGDLGKGVDICGGS